MKTKFFNTLVIFTTMLMLTPMLSFSQPMANPPKNLCLGIEGLNDQQKEQMDKEMLNHQKQMMVLRNQVKEKKARYNSLMVADKADMKAINQVIDELGALKIQMMKQRAQHIQNIRGMLNEEQRLKFDLRKHQGPKPMKKARMNRRMHCAPDCNIDLQNIREEQILDEIEKD